MFGIRSLWRLFLYAGLEKEEYRKLLPSIRRENLVLLRLFSMIAATMFFLLYVASLLAHGFTTINTTTYLLCGIEMLVLLFCARFILPDHPALTMTLVYIFEVMLHVFAIHISMLHADNPAVSAVAFLLVTPLLFYDRPARLSSLIAAVVATFCAITVHLKEPEVAQTDVWNMITFGIVAVAVTMFLGGIKIRSLAQSAQIAYLSQTDLLTGVKNRNQYEKRLEEYPHMCSSSLTCVYADVNGLHELNYREGHAEGDRMLREVAVALRQCFGLEHTYRIGGDEFVAFRVDGTVQHLGADIERLRQDLAQRDYHVSFGIAVRDKASGEMDMRAIVNEAEANMFADKRAFYRRAENDRRSR